MSSSEQLRDVDEYQFNDFNKPLTDFDDVSVYNYDDLKLDSVLTKQVKQGVVERKFAKSSGFKIEEIVRTARGLKDQDIKEYEDRIRIEVEKRVDVIKEEAFKSGFEKGIEDGREELLTRTVEKAEENLAAFSSMISDVVQSQEKILKIKHKEVYSLLRTLTKWIILRELEGDGGYIERLLEKLVIELGSKSNILIRVNQKQFEEMPEILELIQNKIGELKNVRVEIDYDVASQGIIIESDRGIVDGTLETQFIALDKLFEEVGLHNE